ncbi:hypothetical protein D3C83_48360 [compost metagenome]
MSAREAHRATLPAALHDRLHLFRRQYRDEYPAAAAAELPQRRDRVAANFRQQGVALRLDVLSVDLVTRRHQPPRERNADQPEANNANGFLRITHYSLLITH